MPIHKIILDPFSGVGGSAKGWKDAGFRVVGVDKNPQPNYAGDDFIEGDAIDAILKYGKLFHFIAASPPCQTSTALTKGTNYGRVYPRLILATRVALMQSGRPWMLENVAGAPIRKDLKLCGEMFDLGVIRHRFFEFSGVTIPQPVHKNHRGRVSGYRHGEWFDGPYFAVYGDGGGKGSVEEWKTAMGIDWTSERKSIAEAIPPAYTRYIGGHLHNVLS